MGVVSCVSIDADTHPLVDQECSVLVCSNAMFCVWLLGCQGVTVSPVVCLRRCIIHVPRSVVVRARVHARWQAWHSPALILSLPVLVV